MFEPILSQSCFNTTAVAVLQAPSSACAAFNRGREFLFPYVHVSDVLGISSTAIRFQLGNSRTDGSKEDRQGSQSMKSIYLPHVDLLSHLEK